MAPMAFRYYGTSWTADEASTLPRELAAASASASRPQIDMHVLFFVPSILRESCRCMRVTPSGSATKVGEIEMLNICTR